jgi:uncharacterized protein
MLKIDFQNQDFIKLCQLHQVNSMHAFGSVLTDQFNESSDIDLVVDFNPINIEDYADNYFNLKFSLQNIFNRTIDLLERNAIKNPYFLKEMIQNSKRIYG